MEFSVSFWLLAALATLITGISKSGFAGGVGVVAVPLLSLVVSPITAAAIMLPLLVIMDYFSVRIWWGKHNTRMLSQLLPAALIGVIVGYLLFDHLDETALKLQLGILSLAFALWGLTKGSYTPLLKTRMAGRCLSAVAGFTSFVAHAGGPPLNAHLIPLKLPRETFLVTSVMFFAAVNVVKLVPYALLGQLHFDNLIVATTLIPVAWLGVRLGVGIQRYLSDELFYKTILWMLFVISMKLLHEAMI